MVCECGCQLKKFGKNEKIFFIILTCLDVVTFILSIFPICFDESVDYNPTESLDIDGFFLSLLCLFIVLAGIFLFFIHLIIELCGLCNNSCKPGCCCRFCPFAMKIITFLFYTFGFLKYYQFKRKKIGILESDINSFKKEENCRDKSLEIEDDDIPNIKELEAKLDWIEKYYNLNLANVIIVIIFLLSGCILEMVFTCKFRKPLSQQPVYIVQTNQNVPPSIPSRGYEINQANPSEDKIICPNQLQ